jgi:hypothetical protein
VLIDPEQVFINMKAGSIAKPTLRSMIDLYGEVVNGDDAQLLEIGKLRAEIERLKGGQGEAVMKLEAERLWEGEGEYSVSFVKSGWLDQCRKTGGTFLLFTSQPAPVSVDERAAFEAAYARGDFYAAEQASPIQFQDYRKHQAWIAWQARACLDKVKELNQ